ncbi:MAG: short-chain dehydrogenase/reductase [Paenibacillus sp.]|jgi:NAD(P)-dependent dehydrogenase (short-subunit alcohol dehydrogenase family)|nr:short-chain dehydrogenase/reductase [Paenibacillus sp.]
MSHTEQQANQAVKRLTDYVAFVTGAGSGIGRATAIRLAQEGARICLADRNEQRVREVQEQIEQLGGQAITANIDVSDEAGVSEAINRTIAQWNRLDIVFANAGINGTWTPIEQMTADDWDKTMSINLKGTFLAVKYAIPHMKERGGSIVITSSINGSRIYNNIGASAYSASKAGQIAFAKMAALELARYRIRVNVICPGWIRTNIGENTNYTSELQAFNKAMPLPEGNRPFEPKPGQPEQVADLVLFLSSPEASHISGTEMVIDGAESLI